MRTSALLVAASSQLSAVGCWGRLCFDHGKHAALPSATPAAAPLPPGRRFAENRLRRSLLHYDDRYVVSTFIKEGRGDLDGVIARNVEAQGKRERRAALDARWARWGRQEGA